VNIGKGRTTEVRLPAGRGISLFDILPPIQRRIFNCCYVLACLETVSGKNKSGYLVNGVTGLHVIHALLEAVLL
jgi:hypothetical protein